jgi:hypothetical protein
LTNYSRGKLKDSKAYRKLKSQVTNSKKWNEKNRCFFIHLGNSYFIYWNNEYNDCLLLILGIGLQVHPYLIQTYYRFMATHINQRDPFPFTEQSIYEESVNGAWNHVTTADCMQDVFLLNLSPPADFDGMQVSNI